MGHPGLLPGQVTAMSLALIEGSTLARALYRLATHPSPAGRHPLARGTAPPPTCSPRCGTAARPRAWPTGQVPR